MTTPEPRPRCRKLRGTFGAPRRRPGWSLSSPKNRRKKSSPSNCVGDAVALPSTRIVTTAGATALTMSEYESRVPAAAGRVLAVAAGAWATAAIEVGVADTVRQAAPLISAAAAAAASPARRPKRRVLIAGGPFENPFVIRLTRLDGSPPCQVVTGTLQMREVREVLEVREVREVL